MLNSVAGQPGSALRESASPASQPYNQIRFKAFLWIRTLIKALRTADISSNRSATCQNQPMRPWRRVALTTLALLV